MRWIKLILLIISFLIFFILLVGCSPVSFPADYNQTTNKTILKANNSLVDNSNLEIPLPETNPTGCGGWKCISSFVKAYQYENCSFGKTEKCLTSCTNGICAPAKVCDSGFKCSGERWYGFQKEDCSWSNLKECQFGCTNGECNPMLEGYNETNQTNTSETTIPVTVDNPAETVTVYSIKPGEERQLGGQNFRIYNLESDRIILTFNTTRSDWLVIGNEFTIGDTKIEIRDILFQPYEGGTQLVEYIIK